jgi:hypothetical protein
MKEDEEMPEVVDDIVNLPTLKQSGKQAGMVHFITLRLPELYPSMTRTANRQANRREA